MRDESLSSSSLLVRKRDIYSVPGKVSSHLNYPFPNSTQKGAKSTTCHRAKNRKWKGYIFITIRNWYSYSSTSIHKRILEILLRKHQTYGSTSESTFLTSVV